MTVDPRTPCVIGVAQQTWHLTEQEWSPEPLEMQAEVVAAALSDARAAGDLAAAVDGLDVVYCMTWAYDDPAARLAARVGLSPARLDYSGIGGTVPQQRLAAAAQRMREGASEVEVVVGAEALDTTRRMRKAGVEPEWSFLHPDPPPFPFEAPFHPAEMAHEVYQAWLTFAVRDVARRAARGTPPEAHRRGLGDLLAPFTEVAAENPHAWFPTARTAEELVTVTPGNRMVGYPYTKEMVAIMDVDMSAAVVLATWAAADRLGVPTERRVPLRSFAYATDPVYLAEHPDLAASPSMAYASSAALAAAGCDADDLTYLDLYSCFASSVDFARDALGLDAADPRGFTVTGGLPFAGGPASNYMTHAVCSIVERLRDDPGSLGLVSGVGMHMTKHGFAVYGGDPAVPAQPVEGAAPVVTPVPIAEHRRGPATVAAYSVVHDRDGSASWGLAVCDVADGTRTYGRCDDVDLLSAWEAEEWVGRAVVLEPDGEVNRVRAG
jgi:acetyl-CoA C-acetyltransferase